MINIPIKVKTRLIAGVKRFQPILIMARDKDINESDTVTIVSDFLSDVFGYDKYTEITSEFSIKKTFCDLALKLDGQVKLLIEVKSAGLDLKDTHIKQAVDYGSNAGVEWVILTNGVVWKVYEIIFAKPVSMDLLYEIDMSTINMKRQADVELLYYLTKEAMGKSSKSSLDNYCTQKQFLNRFVIGQILLSDTCLDAVRKAIKKLAPDAKISNEEIQQIIADEIIKREVLDGEKAIDAKKRVTKAFKSVNSAPKKTPTPETSIPNGKNQNQE